MGLTSMVAIDTTYFCTIFKMPQIISNARSLIASGVIQRNWLENLQTKRSFMAPRDLAAAYQV